MSPVCPMMSFASSANPRGVRLAKVVRSERNPLNVGPPSLAMVDRLLPLTLPAAFGARSSSGLAADGAHAHDVTFSRSPALLRACPSSGRCSRCGCRVPVVPGLERCSGRPLGVRNTRSLWAGSAGLGRIFRYVVQPFPCHADEWE